VAATPNPWNVLFAEESVTSAGYVISALIGENGSLFIEQLDALTDEVFALPVNERATKLVSLLASFAGIAEIALREAAGEDEDELTLLNCCEKELGDIRENEAQRSG
jgi:hypothetical protein